MRQVVNSQPMFYIPLLHLRVWDWTLKKSALLKLEEKQDITLQQVEGDPFTDYFDNYRASVEEKNPPSYNEEIQEIFGEELEVFNKEFDIKKSTVALSWFQKLKKGGSHNIHNHGPVGFSAVCYVKYDPEVHTPTIFCSPFFNFMNGDMLHYTPSDIQEGDILFFPSVIPHYTYDNHSSTERLIVSFNLSLDS